MPRKRGVCYGLCCPLCGHELRGNYRMVGLCSQCLLRESPEEQLYTWRPDPERARRVEYYRDRASRRLPLFDPPYPGGES